MAHRNLSGTTPLLGGTGAGLEGAGGIGGMLARSHGYSSGNWTNHNCYHADGNGNVTYMINSSQAMVASYKYDPYGNTISSSGSLASANTYRFSSKEINVNSGLYYYGYRWYDPNLQRWLNRDPLGELGFEVIRMLGFHAAFLENVSVEVGEEGDGVNLYVFVGNMVIIVVDVDGLRWWWPPSWPIWHGPHPPQIGPTMTTSPGPGYGNTTYCLGIRFGAPPSAPPDVPPNTLWPPPLPPPSPRGP